MGRQPQRRAAMSVAGWIGRVAGGLALGFVLVAIVVVFLASKMDLDSPRPTSIPDSADETVGEPDVPEETEPSADEPDDQSTGEQRGIQFGAACSPVGALGIVRDGRPAECFMGKDGHARWGYDSDRG